MDFIQFDIKSNQLSPLLATPRTMALLLCGAASYLGFIDPNVRNSLLSIRERLRHYSYMTIDSNKYIGLLKMLSIAFGIGCYLKTKSKFWLYGSLALALVWPINKVFFNDNNQYLLDMDVTANPHI